MSNIEYQSDVKKAHASGVAGADAEVAAAKHVAEEPKMQQKAGILWRHSSCPQDDTDRLYWADKIVLKMKECLNAKELVPKEGAEIGEEHAIYWFTSFCEIIEVQNASVGPDFPLPDPVKRFPSYVARRLLQVPCFDKMRVFVKYFERCRAVDPSMVDDSPWVLAFCKLAAQDAKSDKPFDTNFLSKLPERKLAFQSCAAYSDYKKTRDNERLVLARSSSGMNNEMRLSIIKQLRAKKGSFPADVHDELVCIETVVTATSKEDKV